ncbi:MAG: MOSC domain-containing protein [Chloroflexi bacterium]|nr:MOSC domain-containing protein [Chloroflexota bacterium]
MKLISINIGQERTLQNGNKVETTGIYKIPTSESVEINSLGISNDFIASKKHHGGPDQAVYVYGGADYDWWSQELKREITPGMFGDNLTISELECAQFNIGDRLYIGGIILEVTAPRIPCSTFAARMGDPLFVKKFKEAERPGLYCRVIQEGSVKAGDDVRIEKVSPEKTVSLIQVYRDYYVKDRSEETIRRHLSSPIAIRMRVQLEEELDRLLAKS